MWDGGRDQNALVHGDGGGAALQVAEVRLAARYHERLDARHLDLNLAHGADLDRVSERGAGAWRRARQFPSKRPCAHARRVRARARALAPSHVPALAPHSHFPTFACSPRCLPTLSARPRDSDCLGGFRAP